MEKSRLNESILFNRIHNHNFRGLGADPPTVLREESLFWGGGGWGGGGGVLSAFSKAKLRFPVFFVQSPVYIVQVL